MTDIAYIDVKEFRTRGYLQELNRRFLHPLGLAMSVEVDDETGAEKLAGIWDYRNDPEGICFGGGYGADQAKSDYIDRQWRERQPGRHDRLGFMVQPCGVEPQPPLLPGLPVQSEPPSESEKARLLRELVAERHRSA